MMNLFKKRNPNKPAIGENMLYIMVWAVVILIPILNSKMMSEEHVYMVNILTAWSKLLPYGIIFIINNIFLAPRLLLKKRPAAYLGVSIVMLTLIFYPLEYYQESLRSLPYAGGDLYVVHGRASFTDLAWYWNVLLGLFMMGANCGIKFMFKAIDDDKKLIDMKRQSLQAEMDYLKYQINPHFFMNTLNNIHALIDIDSQAAKDTVIELSKMMRYVLYDSEHKQINISKDIRFVENYISLMKIRYTSDVDVQFDVREPIPLNTHVPPLLLIVFVENAFKHGVSYNKPSFVHINLMCEDGKVKFVVRNSRHTSHKTEQGGMGLENVKKRLALLFGKNYTLAIDDTKGDEYCVTLIIPISDDKVYSN